MIFIAFINIHKIKITVLLYIKEEKMAQPFWKTASVSYKVKQMPTQPREMEIYVCTESVHE